MQEDWSQVSHMYTHTHSLHHMGAPRNNIFSGACGSTEEIKGINIRRYGSSCGFIKLAEMAQAYYGEGKVFQVEQWQTEKFDRRRLTIVVCPRRTGSA